MYYRVSTDLGSLILRHASLPSYVSEGDTPSYLGVSGGVYIEPRLFRCASALKIQICLGKTHIKKVFFLLFGPSQIIQPPLL